MRIVGMLAGVVIVGWCSWARLPLPASPPEPSPPAPSRPGLVRQSQPPEPLVPPIPWPGDAASAHDHDPAASFHPHGPQLCASGCAASRHPTPRLTRRRFVALLREYSRTDAATASQPLDELLFYAAQSRRFLADFQEDWLSAEHRRCLQGQLRFTHARIAIQVIDERGRRRTWLEPTRVPLDRRHVFQMQTNQLPPLVTSGTVKRVGFDRLWTRL